MTAETRAPSAVQHTLIGLTAGFSSACYLLNSRNCAGPAFAQDPLPSSAESSSARAEVNKETSDAPSLTDIGKNFTQNVFGGGGEPLPANREMHLN